MRRIIIKALLRALNSRFLNDSPCEYGWINNVDAFSYQNCVSEDKQRPGITVREMLDTADRFKTCPINKNGLTVIEPDGSTHEATVWDRHELNLALTPKDTND
jgi:hypothetical protein